jgi:hypothetical protein
VRGGHREFSPPQDEINEIVARVEQGGDDARSASQRWRVRDLVNEDGDIYVVDRQVVTAIAELAVVAVTAKNALNEERW